MILRKTVFLLLALLPLSASAATFETVEYPTCTFASRDTGEFVVRDLRCGSDDYGDCSFVSFAYTTVGQGRALRCSEWYLSQIWFAQAGSDFNTGNVYQLPNVPGQNHYEYPNPQTLTGVTLFRMDVSPVSVTFSGASAEPPPEAVPIAYQKDGVTYYHPDSLSFASVVVVLTFVLFGTLVLVAKLLFDLGRWLSGKRKKPKNK